MPIKSNHSIKYENALKRVKNLDRVSGIYKASAIAIDTSGKLYKSKRLGWQGQYRTAKTNAIIFNTMRKQGRDVKTMDQSDVANIKRIIHLGHSTISRSMTPDTVAIATMKSVAEYIKTAIENKIKNGHSLRPLGPRANGIKEFQTQTKGLPPLTRSGQLYNSLSEKYGLVR